MEKNNHFSAVLSAKYFNLTMPRSSFGYTVTYSQYTPYTTDK
jgi:hypothetical protein